MPRRAALCHGVRASACRARSDEFSSLRSLTDRRSLLVASSLAAHVANSSAPAPDERAVFVLEEPDAEVSGAISAIAEALVERAPAQPGGIRKRLPLAQT